MPDIPPRPLDLAAAGGDRTGGHRALCPAVAAGAVAAAPADAAGLRGSWYLATAVRVCARERGMERRGRRVRREWEGKDEPLFFVCVCVCV